MKYRKFGKLDYEASVLGFGCMRLPVKNNGEIEEKEAIKMIRYTIDHGVNYIDTAWYYHGGNSELLVGKVLENSFREKVKIATKLPSSLIRSNKDMDFYLNKQLEKLQTKQIDFYLLHGLNKRNWENYKKLNVFKWIEKLLSQGKVRYIGFSLHDDYNTFTHIVDAYNWDFCQIQYNYLDIDFQAGRKGLKYAAKKEIAVVVMEPLRGGSIVGVIPEQIQNIFNSTIKKKKFS